MSDTLREQVAQAIVDKLASYPAVSQVQRGHVHDDMADAAIGVVLGVVAEQIEALRIPDDGFLMWEDDIQNAELNEVLAMVARLGAVPDGE